MENSVARKNAFWGLKLELDALSWYENITAAASAP